MAGSAKQKRSIDNAVNAVENADFKVKDTAKKKNAKKGLHDEHRKRVKEKFRETGLSGFHEHNVLEFLLFYSIPRRDTNEIAHELINEFGSFSDVLNAPIEDLTKIDGVGLESATFIKLIPEVCRYYMANKVKDRRLIDSTEAAVEILKSYYVNATEEKFVIMYLDGRSCLIKCKEISQGDRNMVFTDFRNLIKDAISLGADGIVISHCHTNGFLNPSANDKEMTEAFYKACKTFNIHLCDHIIFCDGNVFSMSKMKGLKGVKFTF